MQTAKSQSPSRQIPVNRGHSERQNRTLACISTFEMRDAFSKLGNGSRGRRYTHVTLETRKARDMFYICSRICQESIGMMSCLAEGGHLMLGRYHISDMPIVEPDTDLRSRLLARIESKSDEVWSPGDFADLGARAAVDKTLQRLAAAGELRRIDRGLYDRPRTNNLTGRATVPDYRAVIRAVTRRDRARAVIDGMTAANDLLMAALLRASGSVPVERT
ncbi:DUF6088 family protein [Mesorhizobium sp.]|uniref:DUF6088 family protein n=1 Tax=Mesorhizobium sp. TaxID=1871066 RepID=UPI00257AE978|nr:DUF6088 family protein [Mesorhizobium sp.]